jgi:DNA-binding IclR family transcriptional regulator
LVSRVQSIERAFAVLSALGDGPAGVTAIAGRANLPKSTVVRLLRTLQHEQAVEQDGRDGLYRLGSRVATLATGVGERRSLVATTHPYLIELAAATGEAAGLSIPDGGTAHYLDQVGTPNPVSTRDWTGSRLPMHAVSSGVVFVAHMSPLALDRFLAAPLERYTARTVVDPDALRERLRQVALDGFGWVHDEFEDGISSVASGIADGSGEVVAAIHVHGPTYRFPPLGGETEVGTLVADTAARVARVLRQTSG